MSTPTPPAGRRDNGLPSADWGALVDLDPRLSEALLASLADAGVAAYVEPAGGQHAITRASQLPARPLDRLWVDPVRADAARAVVGAEVADLTTLLAELEPGATAHGLVQPVPRSGTHRVLPPPQLPDPPTVTAAPSAQQPPPPDGSEPVEAAGPVEAAADDGPDGPVASSPEPGPPPGSSFGGRTAGGATPGRTEADAVPEDPDLAWQRIVDGYDQQPDHPVPPWPVSEDLDPAPRLRRLPGSRPQPPGARSPGAQPPGAQPPGAQPPGAQPPGAQPPGAQPPGDRRPEDQRRRRDDDESGALPDWVEPEAVEDDGHYVPPPPPPVPRLAPRKLGAVAAILLGLVLLFRPSIVSLFQLSSAAVFVVGLAGVLGGAATLVLLMRDAPDSDVGPDDGAVV